MRLRTKIIALAAAPLLLALVLVALAVWHQERDLAQRERSLIEDSYMAQRRSELRTYGALAISTIKSLYDSGRQDDAAQAEALRRLAALDYGSDGYFFVYDLQGRSLMHSRQPELVGQSLWDLRDTQGRYTLRDLIRAAQQPGGGFVDYEWRKPSSEQTAPKLGYVIVLPRWNWVVGTGLYLDDIQDTLAAVDRQMNANVTVTLLWIAAIAALCLLAVSAAGLWLNLSEHRSAAAQLRLLARRVVQSQEDERHHLARELHDGTSQALVGVKLQIEAYIDSLATPDAPPALTKALQRLNDALQEVRGLSHGLRPALLDTLGLPAALDRLAQDFSDQGGIEASTVVQGAPRPLLPEAKTALFRVAQEALTNVHKHAAGAACVTLTLQFDAASVRLRVQDDGHGFDVPALQMDARRGIGLRNMRERMAAVGGRLRLRSEPGATTIEAELPTPA